MFIIKMQFPLPIWSPLKSLLIVILMSVAYGQDRKITAKLNPGCPSCTSDTILVYAKCDGFADTIHQIWDFTRQTPTVIITVASLNSTLNITWDRFLPTNFTLSEKPRYSFATAIDKIYEYNDLEDNGLIEPKFPQKEYRLSKMIWKLNDSKLTDNEAMVNLIGLINEDWLQGTVNIKLDLIPFKDYAADLPHLIHTANSTLFDISLENLTSSLEYNASRYSLHLLALSTDHVTDNMHYTVRKSLDDEHTPAVFEIIEIKTPSLFSSGEGGYIQFRPVGYRKPMRGFASSTTAHVSDLHRTVIPRRSTLKYFYESFDGSNLLIENLFISFGESGDGYYKSHNYTSWSFVVGYGTPPVEKFSFFVIMVISIGLGVPVLLALSGVVYVVRRRYRQRIDRTRFTNED